MLRGYSFDLIPGPGDLTPDPNWRWEHYCLAAQTIIIWPDLSNLFLIDDLRFFFDLTPDPSPEGDGSATVWQHE
jgi:hypothetical protein